MKRSTPSRNHSTPPPSRVVPRSQVKKGDAWLMHHVYVFLASIKQFFRTPITNLMTAAVIGITLALPTGLLVLLENAHNLSANWGGTLQISLFLDVNVTDEVAHSLSEELLNRDDIQSVRVVTREEALNEYRELSGFADALDALDTNPLPAVLVLQPINIDANLDKNNGLLRELEALPEVDIAQFDIHWLQRLFAILEVIQRGIIVLASVLCAAVLLIVGNTIRLSIYSRHEEIEVNKLFGATNGFIRRPFLYTGLLYGLSGAIFAWLLVNLSFWLLEQPIKQLSRLYYAPFELITLTWQSGSLLLLIGVVLGIIGAWLSVERHLHEIQPH